MAFTPTNKVFDITPIAENILNYVEEFGAEALELAEGDPLPEWDSLFPNAPGRLITAFPALVCMDQAYETDMTGDLLRGGLELTFEGCVTGPNLDDLVWNTKRYAEAFEWLLANIQSEDLTFGCKYTTTGKLLEVSSVLDSAGQLQNANSFLAVFKTKCLYQLSMAAF